MNWSMFVGGACFGVALQCENDRLLREVEHAIPEMAIIMTAMGFIIVRDGVEEEETSFSSQLSKTC